MLLRILLSFLIMWTSLLLHAQRFYEYLQEHPDQNFYITKAELDKYYAEHDRGRGSGYKQYMRWVMETEPNVYPTGEIRNWNAMLYESYMHFVKDQLQMKDMRATHGAWFEEGPLSYTQGNGWNGGNGRVSRMHFQPGDTNTIYACTPMGGMWRTQDQGMTWSPMTDGLPRIGVTGVAVNPNDTDIMYLLTGDGDGFHVPSIGVLKTEDGGVTWKPTGLTWDVSNGVRTYRIIIHPSDPLMVFVVGSFGIMRTTNGGLNWQSVENDYITDIEFRPGSPDTMYASGNDFFVSYNTGLTWTQVNDPDFPSSYNRIETAVSPDDPDRVYLLFGGHIPGTGNGFFSGLYRSDNSGGNFYMTSNSPNILGYDSNGNDSLHQVPYDLAIAVDPNNADNVFTGGINVWRSMDGGYNWTITSHWEYTNNGIGYTHADIHSLEFQGSKLYCGSDGGVFVTSDLGDTWTNHSFGIGMMQFYTFDVENSIIAGGTQDNGCNQWIAGNTNATHTLGADGFACMTNYNNNNIRYQSTFANLRKSTDGGNSFGYINIPGLPDDPYWDVDLLMHPTDPDTIYAGVTEVYRSYNGGGSWTQLDSVFGIGISALAQSPENPDRLYASTINQIRRTDNVHVASPVWQNITNGLPLIAPIMDIAVDPENSTRLWVALGGYHSGVKVYMSSDTGATWTNLSGTLPNIPVFCIQAQPGSTNGLYIGTEIGVFYRNNNIGDWIWFSNGMPVTRVTDLDLDNGEVYAATFGRGVWSSDSYTTCASNYVLTQANDPYLHMSGIQEYHSSGTILSSRIIQGGTGTDVRYHAEQSITLTTGFHVRKDNLFEADLDDCPE